MSQAASAGASTPCAVPAESKATHTLTLPPNYLQPDMVYEFMVTVTSARSAECASERSATERRVINTQSEPLPELQLQVCKDARCANQLDLVGGVAVVSADRQNPNLYVKLQVESQCRADIEVAWDTSLGAEHLATREVLGKHTLKPVGHETLRIAFDYAFPIAAEYTFSTTAECSASSATASVGLGIVMNYGPSGGKMEVRAGVAGCCCRCEPIGVNCLVCWW